jgi:hypothetical protein
VRARKTVAVEKLEAIVKLRMLNSRSKDHFDLASIAANFDLDCTILVEAIRNTFARRRRLIPKEIPIELSNEFATAPGKGMQRSAFCEKSRVPGTLQSWAEGIPKARAFACPLRQAASEAARVMKSSCYLSSQSP